MTKRSETKNYIDCVIQDDGVAVVRINRPEKMNAMSFEMFGQLAQAFQQINTSEKDVRVAILTSNGKHFSAGLDLQSALDLKVEDEGDPARSALKL